MCMPPPPAELRIINPVLDDNPMKRLVALFLFCFISGVAFADNKLFCNTLNHVSQEVNLMGESEPGCHPKECKLFQDVFAKKGNIWAEFLPFSCKLWDTETKSKRITERTVNISVCRDDVKTIVDRYCPKPQASSAEASTAKPAKFLQRIADDEKRTAEDERIRNIFQSEITSLLSSDSLISWVILAGIFLLILALLLLVVWFHRRINHVRKASSEDAALANGKVQSLSDTLAALRKNVEKIEQTVGQLSVGKEKKREEHADGVIIRDSDSGEGEKLALRNVKRPSVENLWNILRLEFFETISSLRVIVTAEQLRDSLVARLESKIQNQIDIASLNVTLNYYDGTVASSRGNLATVGCIDFDPNYCMVFLVPTASYRIDMKHWFDGTPDGSLTTHRPAIARRVGNRIELYKRGELASQRG